MRKPRYKTFKAWRESALSPDQIRDIATHGADCGYPDLTWNSDGVILFDTYGDEIWDLAYDEASDQGVSIPKMIAGFNRLDMADSLDTFKMLMVWFAAETYANRITNGGE